MRSLALSMVKLGKNKKIKKQGLNIFGCNHHLDHTYPFKHIYHSHILKSATFVKYTVPSFGKSP